MFGVRDDCYKLDRYDSVNLFECCNTRQFSFQKGKAIGLPDDFLALNEDSKGGGVIQVCFKKLYQIFNFN